MVGVTAVVVDLIVTLLQEQSWHVFLTQVLVVKGERVAIFLEVRGFQAVHLFYVISICSYVFIPFSVFPMHDEEEHQLFIMVQVANVVFIMVQVINVVVLQDCQLQE